MRVDLSDAAERDLAAIHAYYADRSETAADRVVGVIARSLRGLGRFPLMGKPGHYPGTREHITARYAYRIVNQRRRGAPTPIGGASIRWTCDTAYSFTSAMNPVAPPVANVGTSPTVALPSADPIDACSFSMLS